MKMTQRNNIWDIRTRWKSGSNKTLNIQENFLKFETPKTNSLVPICLDLTGTNLASKEEKLVSNWKDQYSKPRKFLMRNGNGSRTLAKSNSLPPISSPRVSIVSMSSAKTCVPSWGVGCQEKKANILSCHVRMDKALFSRQKPGCQMTAAARMICNGLAVFNERAPVQRDALKISDPSVSANDREEMTKWMKDSVKPAPTLSDSAIEMENEQEMIDSEEDEYYTNQRITAWIVKVNASLFSSTKDEVIEQTLEEQDVDTIKIIYD